MKASLVMKSMKSEETIKDEIKKNENEDGAKSLKEKEMVETVKFRNTDFEKKMVEPVIFGHTNPPKEMTVPVTFGSTNPQKEMIVPVTFGRTDPPKEMIVPVTFGRTDPPKELFQPVTFGHTDPTKGIVEPILFPNQVISKGALEPVTVNPSEANFQKGDKTFFQQKDKNLEMNFFIDAELAIVSGRFMIEKGILYYVDCKESKPICNFVVKILRKIIRFDGTSYESSYILTGVINGKKKLKRISISANDFTSADWIYRLWGLECVLFAGIPAYSFLKEFISLLSQNIDEEIHYNFVGWHFISNKFVYLHGGGAIGGEELVIRGDRSKTLYSNPSLSCQYTFHHILNSIIVGNCNVTLPVLTYNLLSLMTSIFKDAGHEPMFIMWLYGITGSRKTTLAKLFANIFNETSSNIPATFKDTPSALERKAFDFKDSTLILDDYHPSSDSTERAAMNKAGQYVIRLYGDRVGKGRMNRDMSQQKSHIPRGLCLVTGEDMIQGNSTNFRLVPVEITREDLDLNTLTKLQSERIVYTTGIVHFIEYLSCNYIAVRSLIKKSFESERKKALDNYGNGRLAESFVFLQLTLKIFLEYGKNINALSSQECFQRTNWANSIFLNCIQKHEKQMIDQSPEIMYLVAINELIQANKIKILDEASTSTGSNIVGYRTDSCLYLFPKNAYSAVRQFWKEQGKSFPLGESATIKALDKDGILVTTLEGNEKKRTIRNPKIKTSGNGRPRFLTINIEMMNSALRDL